MGLFLEGYYISLQIIGYTMMGIDKRRARKHAWRIPERRLWLFAWLGAGLGLWMGMSFFRHKTKRTGFRVGFPFFTILHVILIIFIVHYWPK